MSEPHRDEEGYLTDPTQWCEAFARRVAEGEGLDLADEHWAVIGFMRRHYEARGVAPDARTVVRFLAQEQGHGRGARRRLHDLFPYGYVKQACKIAGMKRPRAWSTG